MGYAPNETHIATVTGKEVFVMYQKEDYIEINIMRLVGALWRRAWAILLAALIFGTAAFTYTKLCVTPLYKAKTLMYVNNSNISVGGTQLSISQGDLIAAQSLVDTYSVILKTRNTLNEVIESANLDYSYEQLHGMVSAYSVNSTELFYIEVTSADPYEAEKIANTIAMVLPGKISSVVEGSSVRIADYAVVPSQKASPSTTRNTMIGAIIGILLVCVVLVVLELTDELIHDSDYVSQTYEFPVLAVIPDLLNNSKPSSQYKGERTYETATKVGGKGV